MASSEDSKKDEKGVYIPKSAAELQKIRLDKLMKNPVSLWQNGINFLAMETC